MTDLGPLRQAVATAERQRAGLGADATSDERRAALKVLKAARDALNAALREFVDVGDPDELLAKLDPDVPLVLTPVRIETRLLPAGGKPDTLRVRIFPDDLHLESHDPELTDGELQQGRRYWTTVWRAGRGENDAQDHARLKLGAWEQLSGALGPARARWVARVLAPPLDNRPEQPLADDAPAPTPELNAGALRGRGWSRPATASTLPDFFVALAFQGDRPVGRATGRAVPDVIQVGPDPDAAPAPGPMPIDPSLRWLVDFEAAEQNGMAVTVPLTGPGFDPERRPLLTRVLVLGVSASLDARESGGRMAKLLSDHAADGEAAFVAQGTPTNNTEGARRSWGAAPDVEDLLRAASGQVSATEPRANGAVLATALGLPTAAVAPMPGAAEPEQADSRALQLALWSATGDFFIDHLMESQSMNQNLDVDRQWLRSHYADHVRARGPLPVLRLGKQPYGLLPVTSTARWRPDPDAEPSGLDGLHRVLTTLRPFWDVGVQTLPRVGGPDQPGETLGVPKPERDVLRALGMAPVSRATDVRAVRGALNACYRNIDVGNDTDCGGSVEDRLAAALNRALGIDYKPIVALQQNEVHAARLWLPHARLLNLPEGTDPVEELRVFLENVVEEFQLPRLSVGEDHARTLLEALLLHSANLEYGHAAAAVAHHHELVDQARFRITEVTLAPERAVALADSAGVVLRPVAMASLLSLPVPAPEFDGGSASVRQVLDHDRSLLTALVDTAATRGSGVLDVSVLPKRPWSTELSEIDAALRYLGNRALVWRDRGEDAFAALERLLGECLDLVSHRLDAWITSLATARLAAMREPSRRPAGLHLGAYGWVEDLSPCEEESRSAGWVLAPSPAQATTAAILHSGALSHSSDPGAFAVDLSSRRMRVAMAVLDGVRQGQPLGALLGYRLERRLHDVRERESSPLELDRVIASLRRFAPLQAVHHDAPGAQESIAAHDVTDGYTLAEQGVETVMAHLRSEGTLVPPLNGEEDADVKQQLEALNDDADALADLLLAESVHQLTNGNPDRAGATLDALAAGGNPPPRPEVLDVPRQGTPMTHRVLIVVPENAVPARGWDSTAQRGRPRAAAEPRLDAWASHLLGPAGRIRLRAEWVGGQRADDPAVTEHDWPLADHCALDVAALAAAGALRQVLSRALEAQRPPGVPAGAVPVLQGARDHAWARRVVALVEVEALGRAIAAALACARPGTAVQLAPAATPPPAAPDGDLRDRAARAVAGLRAAKDAADLDLLFQYGVVAPRAPHTLPEEELGAQVKAAVQEASSRLKRAEEALSSGGDAMGPVAALEAIFGPGFRAVDLVAVPDQAALAASLGPTLHRGDADAARDWLERMATVRPGAARLADLALHAEAAGTGVDQALRIAQTPFADGDHWVGAVGRPQTAPPATGMVIHGPAGLDLSQPVAVAVVDEWSEVIPGETHTAGASFHFDAPGARPPQAVLLAVPPVRGAVWSVDTLTAVIGETLDLAKVRLVDLQAMAWLGRYLPAAYLPDTALGTAPGIGIKRMINNAVLTGDFAKMIKMES
ncbi:hypothetical protein OHB54_01930 [Streptomyces sp. NBC_01007]|nr:hypothetical protein OHB54_01930 [Streptomyces sp. NBC_01007]